MDNFMIFLKMLRRFATTTKTEKLDLIAGILIVRIIKKKWNGMESNEKKGNYYVPQNGMIKCYLIINFNLAQLKKFSTTRIYFYLINSMGPKNNRYGMIVRTQLSPKCMPIHTTTLQTKKWKKKWETTQINFGQFVRHLTIFKSYFTTTVHIYD